MKRRKNFNNRMNRDNKRYRNHRRRQYNERRYDDNQYDEDDRHYYGKHNRRYSRKGKKRDSDFDFDDFKDYFDDFNDYFDDDRRRSGKNFGYDDYHDSQNDEHYEDEAANFSDMKTSEINTDELETETISEEVGYKGKVYNSVSDWLQEAYQEGQTRTVSMDGKSHVVGVIPSEGIGIRTGDKIVQLNPGFVSSELLPDGSLSNDLKYHIEIDEDRPAQIYDGFDALAVRLSNFIRRLMNSNSGLPIDEVLKSPRNKVFPDPNAKEADGEMENKSLIPVNKPVEMGPITASWVEDEPAGIADKRKRKLLENRQGEYVKDYESLPNLTGRIDCSQEMLEELNLPDGLVSTEALNKKNALMTLNAIRSTLETASVIDDMLSSHNGIGEYYKEWKSLSDYKYDFDKASRARELERIMASRLSMDNEFLQELKEKMSDLAILQKNVIDTTQNSGVLEVLKRQYIVEIESLMSDGGMARLTEVLHFAESVGLSEIKGKTETLSADDMADEDRKNKILESLKENIEAFKRALGALVKKITGDSLGPEADLR